MSDNAEIIEVQEGTRYSAVSNDDHMRFLDETIISLRQQLAAVTAERDAAVSALALATNSTPGRPTVVLMSLDKWTLHLAEAERFGADQWRNGNAGREPQEFDEWRQEQAEDRRAAFNGGEV